MKNLKYILYGAIVLANNVVAQKSERSSILPPQPDNSLNEIIVKGTKLASGNEFHFFYQNQFDNLVNLYRQNNNGTDTAYIQISTQQPVLLYHALNMIFFPVFAVPGDTITIQFNKQKNEYNYTSSKYDNSANILNTVNERCGNLGITFPLFNPKIHFHYYDSVYDQLCINENVLIDSLCQVYNTNNKYKNYLKKEMLYRDIEMKFEPYYYNQKYDLTVIPEWYIVKLNSYKKWINKDSNINLIYYRFFCYWYNVFLLRDSLYSPKLPFYEYSNAKKVFTGKTRDYLLFKIIQENINKGIPGFEKYVSEFQTDCKDSAYKEYIDSLYSRFYGLISDDSVLSSKLISQTGQSITWKRLLNRNKGKVLYIDFWASWCGPCIGEMPYSIALYKKLKDKDISFIYISIDDNKNKWLNAIIRHHLENGGQHYLLEDQRNSPLEKILGIPPIPHYLLLDKKGKTIAIDTYRPNNPRVEKIIKDLLKK